MLVVMDDLSCVYFIVACSVAVPDGGDEDTVRLLYLYCRLACHCVLVCVCQ